MKIPILLCLVIPILVLASCTEEVNMLEQNKALIRDANEELLNKGNLDFADEVFAADYSNPGTTKRGPEVPSSRGMSLWPGRGRAGPLCRPRP